MLRIFEKKKGGFREGDLDEIDSANMSWIDCYSPTAEEISRIAGKMGISEERLLHFIDEDARPHMLEAKEFSVIVWGTPDIQEHRLKKGLAAIFLLPNNNILTLSKGEISLLKKFEEVVSKNAEIIKSPSTLIYSLMGETITSLFSILDVLEEQIDMTEDEVLKKPEKSIIGKIFTIKRDILLLHKIIVANREVVTAIEKGYAKRIPKTESANFRFLYNDLVQLIDMSETYRDIATGIIEIYLSTVSNMLNSTIKKMTAWGSLILLPTLIASIYGMNFQRISEYNMPELYWPYGYLFAIGLMAFSVIFLYSYFKIKRWL